MVRMCLHWLAGWLVASWECLFVKVNFSFIGSNACSARTIMWRMCEPVTRLSSISTDYSYLFAQCWSRSSKRFQRTSLIPHKYIFTWIMNTRTVRNVRPWPPQKTWYISFCQRQCHMMHSKRNEYSFNFLHILGRNNTSECHVSGHQVARARSTLTFCFTFRPDKVVQIISCSHFSFLCVICYTLRSHSLTLRCAAVNVLYQCRLFLCVLMPVLVYFCMQFT